MDEFYMRTALQLAQAVKGQTNPNPPVGAVLVKDKIIRGMGAHLKAGEAHAEVHALNMAGDYAKGATLYVTLEPCSHVGQTNPCARLIAEKGVERVVIATKDPNERVAGQGIAYLKKANIEVELGLLEEEARQLNDVFFHYIKTGRPFITLKSAVSLDGKTATKTGESKWITSEEARLDVHYYRHNHDAILVGVGTVLADNPNLTTRLASGGRNPKRIILDSHLKTPLGANVITNDEAETIIFVGQGVADEKIVHYEKNQHVKVVKLQTDNIEVTNVVKELGKLKIASLFVEGGARVNDSFLRAGLINQFILYIAPKLIGGKNAPTSITGEGIESIKDTFDLKIVNAQQIGPDVKLVALAKGDL